MINVQQAIYNFWCGFGLPVYDEDTVPDTAQLPYITYEAINDFLGAEYVVTTSVWYRSTSWAEVTAKEQEIAERIGRGGIMLPCDGGGIWIKRGTPWAQRIIEPEDRDIRRIALNCELDFVI